MTMWVFGYGSLLWNPGFEAVERAIASLPGYARSFCMHSIHYRGTSTRPGLVLALDAQAGAMCQGVALGVADDKADDVLFYLRERELISSAYREQFVTVALRDGRRVEAVTYVINKDHGQYCGQLELEQQAQVIAAAVGSSGPNTEYLFNTAEHLRALGIRDADLDWLAARVRELVA